MQAILYDGSRCAGCQACAVACKEHFKSPWLKGDESPFGLLGFEQETDGTGDALAISMTERTDAQGNLVWEMNRHGCVHCASAPCKGACPTGALATDEATGFITVDEGRCVNCHLCSVVCPAEAPQHRAENGPIVKCDGCVELIRNGGVPACATACPTGAVVFGDRDELIARANGRAAELRSQGYDSADVVGIDEQGGHQVIQVMKYGVTGSVNEPLATTGGLAWLPGADVAGPLSVGLLAVGGLGATVALMSELKKQQRAMVGAPPTGLVQPCYGDGLETTPLPMPVEPPWVASGESGLEAAMRRREVFLSRQSTTPAAAAASMTTDTQLFPVDFAGYGAEGYEGYDDYEGFDGYEEPAAFESGVSYEGIEGYTAYDAGASYGAEAAYDAYWPGYSYPAYGDVPPADETQL